MKFDYVVQIKEPGDDKPRWGIAFTRKGHFQILNMELKPVQGKVARGQATVVQLEEEKKLTLDQQMRQHTQEQLKSAVRRALYG